MQKRITALTLGALLAAALPAVATTYVVDPVHSNVGFEIRHFVSQVDGRFTDFDGTIVYKPDDVGGSSVDFTVQAESIDTANDKRDGHLRSEDFFHAEKFPTLEFESTAVERVDEDTLNVTGDLTIRGVTKRVTIPVDVLGTMSTPQGTKAGFRTDFTIDRKDYDIVWNRVLDQGGALLGDEVEISIQASTNEKKPEAAAGSEGE